MKNEIYFGSLGNEPAFIFKQEVMISKALTILYIYFNLFLLTFKENWVRIWIISYVRKKKL